jgi:hypothetical protein
MSRRLGVLAAVTVTATIGWAAPASAWWADGKGFAIGQVEIVAEPGEVNDVTVEGKLGLGTVGDGFTAGYADHVIIHDASAPVTPPPPGMGHNCTQVDAHTVRCNGSGYQREPVSVRTLLVDLEDGDDQLRVPPTAASLWVGGSTGGGNDTVTLRSRGGSDIYLGDGDDRMVLRGSDDRGKESPLSDLDGGPGDDVLDVVNLHNDAPYCGDGADVLRADSGEANADCETRVQPLP